MIVKFSRNPYFYLLVIAILNVAILGYQQKNVELNKEQYLIIGVWGGTEADNFNKVLKSFKQQTGIQITYKSIGSDNLMQALKSRVSEEGKIKLMGAIVPQPSIIDVFLQQKAIKKVDSKTEKNLVDNYDMAFWKPLIERDNKIYGIPLGLHNKSIFWFNGNNVQRDTLTSIDSPYDLLNTEKQENDRDGLNFLSMPAGDGWPMTDFFELFYLSINGGEMYDRLMQHKIPYTDPSVAETLKVLKDVAENDKLDARQTTLLNSVTSIYKNPILSKVSYGGTMVIPYLLDSLKLQIGKDGVNYFKIFNGSGQNQILVGGDIYINFQKSDVSKKFANFISDTSSQEKIIGYNPNYLPAIDNIDTKLYKSKYIKDMYKGIRDADKHYDMSDAAPYGFASAPLSPEWRILTSYIYEKMSLKEAQRLLEENIKKYER